MPIRRSKRPLQGPLPLRLPARGGRAPVKALLATLAALLLLGGGFLWFRSSSFVAVNQVEITGVSGADAAVIESTLRSKAMQMSTMHYSVRALQEAVASLHIVRSLQARVSFPHRMSISVTEQLPVAMLTSRSGSAAVAGDGVVLGSQVTAGALPSIAISTLPHSGQLVGGSQLRSYLTILGAAPAPLLPLVSKLYVGIQGLTVQMRNGLIVYFGDDQRPHAKWDSLVAVLTSPSSAGARYVDVRLPERPAAGMPEGSISASEGAQVSATEPTSAALAESLAKAITGQRPIEAASGIVPSLSEPGNVAPSEESPEVNAPESASSGGEGTTPEG